jgi:uncharacterized coiled-coil protein SlyX
VLRLTEQLTAKDKTISELQSKLQLLQDDRCDVKETSSRLSELEDLVDKQEDTINQLKLSLASKERELTATNRRLVDAEKQLDEAFDRTDVLSARANDAEVCDLDSPTR